MRIVKFEGWIIFDENECNHGKDMTSQINHELFNIDGAIEWDLREISNKEIEYEHE